jgi:putative membrane protein
LFNQAKDLDYIRRKNWIDGFGFMQLNTLLIAFTDEMGMSERIKNTVFPPTYNHYTRLFIWILIVSSTFVISNLVGAWSILFGFLLGYVFIITHTIGQKLLNPFEPISTGISLDQITRTIEINMLEVMGETDLPKPVKSVDGIYVM